ncbi:MAG: zinc-ribbon domain-containing protein [Deltaproteobacteria bacterium]|nr:zinc-ribbon domain-containing protein [Deltaproteobacteria bacterium]
MRIVCPKCGASGNIPDDKANIKIKCPACQKIFVPGEDVFSDIRVESFLDDFGYRVRLIPPISLTGLRPGEEPPISRYQQFPFEVEKLVKKLDATLGPMYSGKATLFKNPKPHICLYQIFRSQKEAQGVVRMIETAVSEITGEVFLSVMKRRIQEALDKCQDKEKLRQIGIILGTVKRE